MKLEQSGNRKEQSKMADKKHNNETSIEKLVDDLVAKNEERQAEIKGMNIYQKMLEVMKSIERLQKDTNVDYNGKTKYKAMSEEKVTSTVREKFISLGLVMYPFEQEISQTGNITTTNTRYRLVNTDNPEESIVIASSGQGADTQDKGSGKAMTYSFKYALLRTFAIPTGEDPDKIHSNELTDQFENEEKSKEFAEETEKKKGELKALLEETDSDVTQFLKWCEKKFERKLKNVDELNALELDEAIKKVIAKKNKEAKESEGTSNE